MKLVHPELMSVLCTDEPGVQTIVIENQNFMRKLILGLHSQINGSEGLFVLSKNDTPLDFAKNAELIDDVLFFDLNRKPLISKIISAMEFEATEGENIFEQNELLQRLELFLDKLAFPIPCDITYSKLSFSSIIKAVGVELRDEYDNPLERLLDYMELVREFAGDKLFIIFNLRNFFGDKETELFLDTACRHAYNLIMFESHDYPRLKSERRITIDSDLCEF